jgi:hypothetical protein
LARRESRFHLDRLIAARITGAAMAMIASIDEDRQPHGDELGWMSAAGK